MSKEAWVGSAFLLGAHRNVSRGVRDASSASVGTVRDDRRGPPPLWHA